MESATGHGGFDQVWHPREYSVPLKQAEDILTHRQSMLIAKHGKRLQLPRDWQSPTFVFSTVHHFKRGECDVTVLAEDVDIHTRNEDCRDS